MAGRSHSVASVWRAAACAAGVHAVLLLLLGISARGKAPTGFDLEALASSDVEPWIDLAAPDEVVLAALPALASAEPVPHDPLPLADSAQLDTHAAAGGRGLVGEKQSPAPDSGEGDGRNLPAAWRRDSSTLRARLTDGSTYYTPSRERTARVASSPQASRMERRVALGDSARTKAPRVTEETAEVQPSTTEPSDDDDAHPAPAEATSRPRVAGLDDARGEGPLDAESGQRAFDVAREGPANETSAARAASNEPEPSLTDFTTASAHGPTDGAGKGTAPTPGAVSLPSNGQAASTDGWPSPRPAIGEIGDGSDERKYSREIQEIFRRVHDALVFPKRLALMLEQGEAIVHFQVDRDGRVSGEVKLTKSAGFAEFDREAVDAVRRAAPFPRRDQPLLVRLRVPFENPLVR